VLATVNGVRALRHARLTSSEKARRELGATFRPLIETLRDEVAWFRAHRHVA
jgi:dihydroflavonol-4-reductase